MLYHDSEALCIARSKKADRSLYERYIPASEERHLKRLHCDIKVEQLVPFRNHPLFSYDEDRLCDMAESIKANGIISPIIVRPLGETGNIRRYEILSGHNRVKAAKMVGRESVPANILEGLTDDEAELIFVESNLSQRSLSDMLPSEQAAAISVLYGAMKKKPGYRSDLIEAIEKMTCSPVANRLRTMATLGKHYGMSKDTIARYLRIHRLIASWQDRLDKKILSFRAAVDLSYLNPQDQSMIEQLLGDRKKLSASQAKSLKKASSTGKLTEEKARQILAIPPKKVKTVALRQELFAQYFHEDQTTEEIEEVLARALELYFRQDHNAEAH